MVKYLDIVLDNQQEQDIYHSLKVQVVLLSVERVVLSASRPLVWLQVVLDELKMVL